jgi:hypothetical protein
MRKTAIALGLLLAWVIIYDTIMDEVERQKGVQ